MDEGPSLGNSLRFFCTTQDQITIQIVGFSIFRKSIHDLYGKASNEFGFLGFAHIMTIASPQTASIPGQNIIALFSLEFFRKNSSEKRAIIF